VNAAQLVAVHAPDDRTGTDRVLAWWSDVYAVWRHHPVGIWRLAAYAIWHHEKMGHVLPGREDPRLRRDVFSRGTQLGLFADVVPFTVRKRKR
jgi:hypothetical protein